MHTALNKGVYSNKQNSYFVARINLPQTETADLMLMVMPASKSENKVSQGLDS